MYVLWKGDYNRRKFAASQMSKSKDLSYSEMCNKESHQE